METGALALLTGPHVQGLAPAGAEVTDAFVPHQGAAASYSPARSSFTSCRNPYVVFLSTVNLWKSLYEKHGLQRPTFAGLEEHVFTTFTRLYEKLEEGRRLLAPADFYELRYEELVADPLEEMRGLYEHLGLGGFEEAARHWRSTCGEWRAIGRTSTRARPNYARRSCADGAT